MLSLIKDFERVSSETLPTLLENVDMTNPNLALAQLAICASKLEYWAVLCGIVELGGDFRKGLLENLPYQAIRNDPATAKDNQLLHKVHITSGIAYSSLLDACYVLNSAFAYIAIDTSTLNSIAECVGIVDREKFKECVKRNLGITIGEAVPA